MLPLPPRLSGLPVLGNALHFLRDSCRTIERGYEAHGRVFSLRLGPRNAVVLLGPEHNRFFFEETDRLLDIRDAYRFFVPMFDDRTFFMAEHAEYLEQKAIALPAFSPRKLDEYVGAMVAEAEAWLAGLGDEGVLDLIEAVGPVVMWIAARAFLGEAFRSGLDRDFFRVFRDFSGAMDPVLPLWLPLPKFRRRDRARAAIHAMVQREIDLRRAHPDRYDDFLRTLCEARYADGTPLPDSVVTNMVLVFAWAGHETTVGHTAWAVVQLLQNPDWLRTVLEEQAAVLGGAATPSLAALRSMKRLEWALKESERMRPVAHVLMRGARGHFEQGGFHVPAGWDVFVSPWVSHHLPDVFRDPRRYDPTRFSPERAEDRQPYSLIGFGGGGHRCLGVNFAYLEMKVLVTMLLSRYEVELVDPDPRPVPGAQTHWPERPCRIRYRRRTSRPAPGGVAVETAPAEPGAGCPFHRS